MSELKYGKGSLKALSTINPVIRPVLQSLLDDGIDHTVVCGHRNEHDQNEAFYAIPPRSHLKWPDSEHNKLPSDAVDVVPYVKVNGLKGGIHWNADVIIAQGFSVQEANKIVESYNKQMVLFAGMFIIRAHHFGIILRWGGDWNKDWSLMDNRFNDYPHFEIVMHK